MAAIGNPFESPASFILTLIILFFAMFLFIGVALISFTPQLESPEERKKK
jgi:hypothetical protein